MARLRLDALLVQQGLVSGRNQAKGYILAGQVLVEGRREDKVGTLIDEKACVTIVGKTLQYVSRGGLKMEKALDRFNICLQEFDVLDLGASTGGFTDCCLKRGARHVTAVDVGYGQLAWNLRNDSRVRVLERTNARYVSPDIVGGPFDFICADLSFISLAKIFPAVPSLLKESGRMVTLVKPQFEAGRAQVGKKGVVRDVAVHRDVIRNVFVSAATQGLWPCGLTFSPVTGPEGNIEYLACFTKALPKESQQIGSTEIDLVVEDAATTLLELRR